MARDNSDVDEPYVRRRGLGKATIARKQAERATVTPKSSKTQHQLQGPSSPAPRGTKRQRSPDSRCEQGPRRRNPRASAITPSAAYRRYRAAVKERNLAFYAIDPRT
ncbi:hypothetical protein AURDEDRAFT_169706 [Auricularia subglabra TFB-10046 SS5]|nr:hypothetical protein AURDEDRAFT_169706 [Auricularia subglabra TFB-10046 SS5]